MRKISCILYLFFTIFGNLQAAPATPQDPCEAHYRQAEVLQKAKKYAKALERYQQAATGKCQDKSKRAADAWRRIGGIHRKQRRPGKAEQAYQKSLAVQDKKAAGQEDKSLALTLDGLGALYESQHKYASAKPLYRRALEIWEKTLGAEDAYTATRMNALALLCMKLGEYQAAAPLFKRALAIREKVYGPEHIYVAYSLNSLSRLYSKLNDYAQAEPLLKRALAIKEKARGPEHLDLAATLNTLALLYNNKNDYARAEPLYQRALAIRKKNLGPEHPDTATSSHNLGLLYSNLNDHERAEPLYLRALEIREKALGPEHPRVAATLNALALLYHHQGTDYYDRAESCYRRALAIWEKTLGAEHPSVATVRNNLAGLYSKQKDHAHAAENLYRDALAIQEKTLGADHPEAAVTLNNLAMRYNASGDYEHAEEFYLRALQIAVTAEQPELLWLVQSNLANLLARQNYPDAAIFLGKQSVNTLQGLRVEISGMEKSLRRSFLKDKARVYEKLADLLMEQGRLLEAQQVLVMLKEEEYFDFVDRDVEADLRETQADYNLLEKKQAQRYKGVRQKLAALQQERKALEQNTERGAKENARLAVLRAETASAKEAFGTYFAHLKQESGQGRTAHEPEAEMLEGLKQLQSTLGNLGEGTVLLHYLMTASKLRIILTTADKQLAREAAAGKTELNRKILEFHQALQDPLKTPLTEAYGLYQWVFEPVAADLEQAGAKTLMLSLDGAMHYIPVAALHDGSQYIAERYATVTYTEAARGTLDRKPAARWRVAGLGLSDAVPGFIPLPAVQAELEGIVRRSSDDADGVIDGEVYLNQDFSAETMLDLLNANYPVMHIASHFVFEPGSEQASYLLLGNGEKLTLARIRRSYNFDNLDLLTLSACDTAMGELANGREIEGFGALAQNRGAKGVLATLWPVNDESTGQFMQALYSNYITQKSGKAEALRLAQQAFIRAGKKNEQAAGTPGLPYHYARPYYWAPFILMGNWL
ncbi:MAG: tetratricopeptide repeat protein [Gammaproteobacteria bacterium]|nr:tetratricopeptide repeat protein [Gammaproteobacteria bacterium]